MTRNSYRRRRRPGAIAVLTAFLIVALMGMVAFAVDYGYLLKMRTDLQRAADAAALAATQDLILLADGTHDLDQVRATARAYARENLGEASFVVADGDIEIGRFDPTTIYTNVTLLNDGTFDTVRVTLRRDGNSNALVPLMFARVLGREQATVIASATAALQKAEFLPPGADVLPFGTPLDLWDDLDVGETWSAYGDGKLEDELGNDIPGNWGTVDIGKDGNSTDDINDQILYGLRQSDLEALHENGRIAEPSLLDSTDPAWMSADTGLSVGIKQSVLEVHGQQRLVPIYDQLQGNAGELLEFRIVRWGVVTVVDSNWQGQVNTNVILRKSHTFSGELRPKPDLASGTAYIEGAYTSPVLIE